MSRRHDVVAAIDLRALATELLGPPVGVGRSAKWHCPDPDHADQHPSMSVFDTAAGNRWHCFACGAGGTCLDLWMDHHRVGFPAALDELAARAGIAPDPPGERPRQPRPHHQRPATASSHANAPSGPPAPPRRPAPPPPTIQRPPHPGIETYVAGAARLLWSPHGNRARDWLAARGLTDETVLRRNRIGFDPGPKQLRRVRGLPHKAAGIVYPVLDDDGRAVFLQLRYLKPPPDVGKYANPVSDLAANPRIATIHPAGAPLSHDTLVITEGIPDALAVAHCQMTAAAALGTAAPDRAVAHRFARQRPDGIIVIAFDNDPAGNQARDRLCALLADTPTTATILTLSPPAEHVDLNAWWAANPDRMAHSLARAARPGPHTPLQLQPVDGLVLAAP